MKDGIQENLRLALRMMFKPLVRLLISQGVTHADFSEAAKDVYVEVACRHFMADQKVNQSRIAVLTGLTRKEVKNVLVRAFETESHGREFSRPSKLLVGWNSDPAFTGPYGVPLDLPYDSSDPSEPSFKMLVKVYGADMSAKSMLEVLVDAGSVVEREDNLYKLVRRSFEPTPLSAQLLERFGEVAQNFFSTASRNIDKSTGEEALFERVVFSNKKLSKEGLANFSKYMKSKGQSFLEEVDNWVVSLEKSDIETEDAMNTGIGMYQYIESPDDKQPLKELLVERGVERNFSDND